MTVVMLQVISSFYTNYPNNSLFNSANNYQKHIVSKKYSFAHHDDNICFPPILIRGDIIELLQELDALCFTYEHAECLYTLFNYQFCGKKMSTVDQLLTKCRGQFISTTKTEDWTECPASRKRDSWEEKYKKQMLSSFHKTKLTQATGSVSADRNEHF